MGDIKLCLLLLLSTTALTLAQDDDQPTCLLAKRYKTLHKYEYQYQAESMNEINGASSLKNGPKATCTVEIEVPQTCSFILRTTGCSLTEVVDTDAEGNPVFEPAPSSGAFAAEMEKHPLKFVVEGEYDVKLYPEEGETTTILNFKRGIISALAVPLLEEDKNRNMPTIHGKCKTLHQVNAREDIATDISLNRYLSKCDKFVPIKDHSSPLALISGMSFPLAQLFNSFQTCNYKFDNEKKHMTFGSCSETHILIPFSHKGENGVKNIGKQELTLVQVSSHNDRVFERGDIVKGLHMEAVEDKSVIQDKDAFLKLLTHLATLAENEGEKRAHLFHKLVTMVRGMKTETLGPAIPKALEVSHALTYQVLAQCGTPECSSAIMQILRTFDKFSFQTDATVFALGFISNPSALLINDMLEMAKFKPSKPIMYALSNVVKRFYKAEGKLIPEIHSVAEFMAARLSDCSGSDADNFMTLRVVGNMAPAVIAASPALRSSVIQCVNQPAASLAVQQAAIQVYRLISVPEDDRETLMQVLLDSTSPAQKRIAAYLVLMKDPQTSELVQLTEVLPNEKEIQVKSFVISHINNILTSTETETQELRQRIHNALQGNEVGPIMDRTKFSSNYKVGSVEGNMLFEGSGFLPKEVMLEMTLKAFGYDIDMMEIGLAGKGFEPTIEALFGENGFFPDTAMKTMYFVSENMPHSVNEILQNMLPALKKDRMKRQAPTNLIKEIEHNLNKLADELKASESPEAMVYLRLLGNELGYLRTNDVEGLAFSAAKMIENLFKMFPTDLMAALMTKSDNTIFGHYIFMDNEFFLPTVTGVPLKITLSGTFTPGIKGGVRIARDKSEVTFMPSAGIEFVTHIGSHIPEYVNSGLEMHTNIFHESGLSAKISVNHDQVKLTIPAPTSPTKLIKITNTLVAVVGSDEKTIPSVVPDKVDVSECTPVFAGIKYCSALQYTNAFSQETSPYFPLTGDSKFSMEFHPTGEVTEYTATVAYEVLREGEEGRQKVDTVKFILRAEGAEPTEARAILKYNRRKSVMTADLQIPDFDVETGLRLGVDEKTKGKGTHSISLDFLNKNIPQLSLVGRANLKDMKEAMLQGQLIVPSINADATVTANVKHDEELELELKSEFKLMDATSEQSIVMIYGGEKIAIEFKSDVNTKTTNLPGSKVFAMYGEEFLNTQVGQTDMKVRHIFKKFVEAANNYVKKYGATIPYIKNIRIPDIPEISLPEKFFLTTEAKAAYYFSNAYYTFAIPVPFGGKSTRDFNFPPSLNTPSISVPQFGLDVASVEIPIPEIVVPLTLKMFVPLFGKAEVSTLVSSNLYNMEASMAMERDTQSYSASLNVKGTSPFDILSIKIDGLGNLAITDSIRANMKGSLVHKLIEASLSIDEDTTFTDKINLRSDIKIEAMSPLGVSFGIEHTGMTGFNIEEFSVDNNFKGMCKVGPMYVTTISTQSFDFFPFRPEAKMDSTVQFDSTIAKVENTISASFANGDLSLVSKTKAFEEALTHVAELSFKDHQLSWKCDANALVLGMKIQRHTEASASTREVTIKMETNVELSENRGYSLLTASLDMNGLAVNSNAMLNLLENKGIHNASLTINKDGLTTSGTTSLRSPLSLENTFNAGVHFSKASMSITNRAALSDINVNNAITMTITLSTLDFNSKTQATASEYASYTQDVTIGLKPYSASANVNTNLNLLSANLKNEAQLQAELYKIDVTGSLKATYGNEEIKHTYEVKYADLTANVKFSTTGKLLGTHMNHKTELEVVGLAASINNEANFNSQPMRFGHYFRCSIVPFDISVDALFNADGDITMYGKHSTQLYGKYLLKAQPLALVSSHECRGSVTNILDNNFSFETTFDSNIGIILLPQEQKTTFKMTSKMNEHSLKQGISFYNTAERTGIEIIGTIYTNLLNPNSIENQEFTVSSFLKYDKNTDSHIIQFPLIENIAIILESMKGFVVHIAEEFQNYMNIYEFKVLDGLQQEVTSFISRLDIAGNAIQLKQHFSEFMKDSISFDYLEFYLRELQRCFENLLSGLSMLIGELKFSIDEMMPSDALLQKAWQQLLALDEKYQIRKYILTKIEMLKPCIAEILSLIPKDILSDPINYIIEVVKVLDIPSKIRELLEKYEIDKIIEPLLEKFVDFLQKLNIEKTILDALQIMKEWHIPKPIEVINMAINTLKKTDVKSMIKELNMFIEFLGNANLQNYNEFIEFTNVIIAESTAYVNELFRTLEISQQLEATKDLVYFILSAFRGFMEKLREVKVIEIILTLKYTIEEEVIGNIKGVAQILKEQITNLNLNEIANYLNVIKKCHIRVITIIMGTFMDAVEMVKDAAPDLHIIKEIQQIIISLKKEIMKAEVTLPSFPVPLTDLVVPSIVFRMDELELPTQVEIPEFTILGTYTYKTTTISFDEIKQTIVELIDFIINLEIEIDIGALFDDQINLSFLPSIPGIIFPEITFPKISFPTIPTFPVEKHVKSIQVPEFKVPTIPTEITVPSFGKLHGEIRILTPLYTIKMSGEFQTASENKMTPQFTGFLNSQAISPYFEILNYELNSTARIAIPKMKRVVLAETVKLNHFALIIDHQASVSLYGRSGQAQAKTKAKVKTNPYTADFVTEAFIAMGGGMSASVNTMYSHLVDIPSINVRSEATLNQKSVARQDGLSFALTVDNSGKGKLNDEGGNHKSNLQLSVNPSTITLTFSGDTDSTILKMKQQVTAESGTFKYFKFDIRSEAEAPVIKNSVLTASGQGNIIDMKVELKMNHDTELHGEVTGAVSNVINFVARPFEFVYEMQNKGNVMVSILKTLSAKIDLQKDYSIILRPDKQQMATVALARLNQYKVFYNFTLNNAEKEAGVFFAMESASNLDFLTFPINIPEIYLPYTDMHTSAINGLNLYEQTGLKNILITTDQTFDLDAKIFYQKGQPFAEIMGLIQIPYVGNMITELSFKSAIINLNTNAGLYAEDNLVFRLGATTASVFQSLNAKLHGTTSLTTRRGLKLASSFSFENAHIAGSHDSSISTSSETFETTVSLATAAKITLPIFNLETKQNFVANTKNKANLISTFTIKSDLNLPVIEAVAKGEADHNMKLEGTFEYISMEQTTRANMDGTVDANYLLLGVLDNEVTVYINRDGLRSTSKVTADTKINHGTTRVIGIDVNESFDVDASLSHVYAVLKYSGNNEAKLLNFNTKGKHIAHATIDLAPTSSLSANAEVDIFQPSNLGDLTFSAKTGAEVTVPKQTISTSAKFSSPLYTTNLEVKLEGELPILKASFKSTGTSDDVFLEYDINASTTANFEHEALNMISKAALTSADITIDVNHIITKPLRFKRQVDNSASRHTLNVDIASPTVTYANLQYTAERNGISASVSTLYTGLLGLQVNGPSQMSARVYNRYPSTPEVEIDILVIKTIPMDSHEMNLQIAYNIDEQNIMLSEIMSTVKMYADQVLTELTKSIAFALEMTMNTILTEIEDYYTSFVDSISGIEIQMPDGEVMTGDKILEKVETHFKLIYQEIIDSVNSMESLNTIHIKINGIIRAATEKSKEMYDSAISYYLSAIHENIGIDINNIFGQIHSEYLKLSNTVYDYITEIIRYLFDQYTILERNVSHFMRQVSEEAKPYIDYSDGRLEINLSIPFHQ